MNIMPRNFWNFCEPQEKGGSTANSNTDYDSEALFALADRIISDIQEALRERMIQKGCSRLKELHSQYGEDATLVILANPGEGAAVCTADQCRKVLPDGAFDSGAELIFGDMLLAHFDKDDIIEVDSARYLAGNAVIMELDHDGNECGVTCETIYNFMDFLEANRVLLEEKGETFAAFRLE